MRNFKSFGKVEAPPGASILSFNPCNPVLLGRTVDAVIILAIRIDDLSLGLGLGLNMGLGLFLVFWLSLRLRMDLGMRLNHLMGLLMGLGLNMGLGLILIL